MLDGLFPLLKVENGTSHFTSKEQFEWGRALLIQGLLLPIEYVETMYQTVDVYQTWLLSPDSRPQYLKEKEVEQFLKSIILELLLLFSPRPYSTTGTISTDTVEPIKQETPVVEEAAVKSKRGLLNLKQFNILHHNSPKNTQTQQIIEETSNKITYTPKEKYIELLKQILQIFTVLTRIPNSSAWKKTIIQTVVKCMTGVADYCLKQGNEDEEMLEIEREFRSSDPMWSQVGSSVSELLMRNFFEVWFRTETVDDMMWNTLIYRVKYWTHRPQVVEDWATAVVAFTRRSARILYDEDPRIGTRMLIVELGLNRFIQLDLSNDYIIFTWPRLLNLIQDTYNLSGDSFRAAINGMSTIVRELLDLDQIPTNYKLDIKYQTYIQGPSTNMILDMVGDHFFNAILKASSDSYIHNQGRALASAILCNIFSRPLKIGESIQENYLNLFYVSLKEAFSDSACLQSILTHGQNLLVGGLPGIRSFAWSFAYSVLQVIPQLAPMLTIAVNPDKLRNGALHIMSSLLSMTHKLQTVELIQENGSDDESSTSIKDNISKKSRSIKSISSKKSIQNSEFDHTKNKSIEINSIDTSNKDSSVIPVKCQANGNSDESKEDIQSFYTDQIFGSLNLDFSNNNADDISNVQDFSIFNDNFSQTSFFVPKNMQDVYSSLLPQLLLSVSSETNDDNMSIIVNTLVVASMQNNQPDSDFHVHTVELLLSELSQVSHPRERELQLIRGLRLMCIILKNQAHKYLATQVISDLYSVFLNTLNRTIEDVYLQVLGEILECIRWWLIQNVWLINDPKSAEKISEIWRLSTGLNAFIIKKDSAPIPKESDNEEIDEIDDIASTIGRNSKINNESFPDQQKIQNNISSFASNTISNLGFGMNKYIESSTKNDPIPETAELPGSKKINTFFASTKAKLAKKLVDDVFKANDMDDKSSNIGIASQSISNKNIDQLAYESASIQEPKVKSLISNIKNVLNGSYEGKYDNDQILSSPYTSNKTIVSTHGIVNEYTGFLHRLFSGYSQQESFINPGERNNYVDKMVDQNILNDNIMIQKNQGTNKSIKNFYYFERSSTILTICCKDELSFIVDIHSPYTSHSYSISAPSINDEYEHLSSFYDAAFVSSLEKSVLFSPISFKDIGSFNRVSSENMDEASFSQTNFSSTSPVIKNNSRESTNHITSKPKNLNGVPDDNNLAENQQSVLPYSNLDSEGGVSLLPKNSRIMENNLASIGNLGLSLATRLNKRDSMLATNGNLPYIDISNSGQRTTINPELDKLIKNNGETFVNEIESLEKSILLQGSSKENIYTNHQNLIKQITFEPIGKHLEKMKKFNMGIHRLPLFLGNQVVYGLDADFEIEQRIQDITSFSTVLEIKAGIIYLPFEKEFESDDSEYSRICMDLVSFCSKSPETKLRVGEQEFSLPRSMGYDLSYISGESASQQSANQYVLYLGTRKSNSMETMHLSLRLRNEGKTGVASIDKHFEYLNEQNNITQKQNQGSSKSVNDLKPANLITKSTISGSSSLRVFYLVTPLSDTNNLLVQVKKIVYGASQTDSEHLISKFGPVYNDSIIHMDYLAVLLSLTVVETQKAINKILDVDSSIFSARKSQIRKIADSCNSYRAFLI
ncbi:hypothetical protein BB559_003672 [Furculomyces boomerangus]|uniref:Ral GTPase-activating protein subunit alpha/beta N-terminal domain-containing protein n=1 Tax=Furculomyces boomerangus TaxID=61424 RepID=A0A2T9YJU2_9FUNG|nr:hypothetical protein BB559_003672 [Furculomyces boomerangus]